MNKEPIIKPTIRFPEVAKPKIPATITYTLLFMELNILEVAIVEKFILRWFHPTKDIFIPCKKTDIGIKKIYFWIKLKFKSTNNLDGINNREIKITVDVIIDINDPKRTKSQASLSSSGITIASWKLKLENVVNGPLIDPNKLNTPNIAGLYSLAIIGIKK